MVWCVQLYGVHYGNSIHVYKVYGSNQDHKCFQIFSHRSFLCAGNFILFFASHFELRHGLFCRELPQCAKEPGVTPPLFLGHLLSSPRTTSWTPHCYSICIHLLVSGSEWDHGICLSELACFTGTFPILRSRQAASWCLLHFTFPRAVCEIPTSPHPRPILLLPFFMTAILGP